MRKHHIGIPIVCLDKDTYELLNTYDSAAEAERKKRYSAEKYSLLLHKRKQYVRRLSLDESYRLQRMDK